VLEARVHALGLDEAASFGNAPGADRPHAELPHAAIGAGEQTFALCRRNGLIDGAPDASGAVAGGDALRQRLAELAGESSSPRARSTVITPSSF